MRYTLIALTLLCLCAPKAWADIPFDPELLEDTGINIEKRKEGDPPYLLYGFKKNKLLITTSDGLFSFIPTFTLQFRHEARWDKGLLEQNSFYLRRARVQTNGTFLSSDLKYEFDVELRTPREDQAPFRLQDFSLDYRFNPWAQIRLGQYKVPLSYQFEVSGIRQQFNERSIANGAFSPGRDIGLMFHGEVPDRSLLYHVGLFNGEGQNRFNENKHFASFAQLTYTPWGRYPTEESDWERVPDPRLLVQSALWQNKVEAAQILNGALFTGFKWQGLSVHGHLFKHWVFSDRAPEDINDWGGYVQAGYFWIPRKLETALRTSHVFSEQWAQNQHEYALAVNYYFLSHALKLQTDYTLQSQSGSQAPEGFTHRFLSQIQMAF